VIDVPGQHPETDLLADLAADVLPEHEARAVEAHVIGCHRCADLLADAERVRVLLRSDDPGPMPADVLARLEAVLAQEAAARTDVAMPPLFDASTGAAPLLDTPWAETGQHGRDARPDGRERPATGRRASVGGDTAWETEQLPLPGRPRRSVSPTGPASPGAGPAGRRPGRGAQRSRRDVRADGRTAGVTALLERIGGPKVLAAAAGVVLVVGLGGYTATSLLNRHSASDALTSAGAAESRSVAAAGPLDARLSSTGTAYTRAALTSQVRTLLAQGPPGTGVSSPRSPAVAGSADPGSAPAVPGPTRQTASSGESDGGSGQSAGKGLADPATLRACIDALNPDGVGPGGADPVAVDFGTFDGREAAIIVLAVPGGGYEVWAVARDCGPGQENALAIERIPS
jgi:hypothetical protein